MASPLPPIASTGTGREPVPQVQLGRIIGRWLPGSFAVLIGVGAVLLKLPMAVAMGTLPMSWMDAFFTAISAACMTGLAVRDTAAQFTPFGQTVIGGMIQIGGLLTMIFGSILVMHLTAEWRRRQPTRKDIMRMMGCIVLMTLALELIGAIATYGCWQGDMTFPRRAGLSAFHAISAFCNAGFTLFPENLQAYRYSTPAHLLILPLVVLGGLGYPVLHEWWMVTRARWRPAAIANTSLPGVGLHAKVVLTTTACLYLLGAIALFTSRMMPYIADAAGQNVTANRATLEPLSLSRLGAVLADSSFMALSARTAGFHTMPLESVGPAGHVTLMALMLVGGSPGGTAGGMKTTTLALIVLGVAATLRRRHTMQIDGHIVEESMLRQAIALATLMLLVMGVFTFLLCLTEPFPFMKILFEVVSATSATGLSLGITAALSTFGKGVIMLAMVAGRLGPLLLVGWMMLPSTAVDGREGGSRVGIPDRLARKLNLIAPR